MKRFSLFLFLALALLVGLAPSAHAQGDGVAPQITDSTWQARYWNNVSLSGTPVLTRSESDVNRAATLDSFAPGVNADNFSARFEKYIDVTAGSYRFRVTVDDGVRVYVDDRLIIDKWFDQGATTYTADLTLTTGYHYVVVDYYDRTQFAQVQFSWGPAGAPAPAPGPWAAEFWNNPTFAGAATVSTTVAEINFDWGRNAPMAGIPADNFSARFKRTVNLPQGTYRFFATTDDGMRIFVAGRPVISEWRAQSVRTFTYDMFIPGGDTEIVVEYYEATGNAVAKARWEKLGSTPPPAPSPGEVIVEDGSNGFTTGGTTTSFRTANEGSGGRLTWTRNNQVERPNYNWARWYPSLNAGGRYEVFAYIPDRYTTTTNATYWISHRDGMASVRINQSTNGNKWVSLGTYTFAGSRSDYVGLNDITGERYLSSIIGFDAMKFVPR